MKYIAINLLFLLTAINMYGVTYEATLYALTEKGLGESVGKIVVEEMDKGGIKINLYGTNLAPGYHGFHLHETNTLGPSKNNKKELVIGGLAGGHWDPDKTGKHLGPNKNGHRGDLPKIKVSKNGILKQQVISKKINISDILGKSLMIHMHSDNYSDHPMPLGGGGGRLYAAPFKK
ncbi:MAG: superoxide dismutase family protein [Brevinema sp.]